MKLRTRQKPSVHASLTQRDETGNGNGAIKLGEQLISVGLVGETELEAVLASQAERPGLRLGELLLEISLLDEHQLAEALARQHGYDVVRLSERGPAAGSETELAEDVARRFKAVPLGRVDGTLEVAVADPTTETIAELRDIAGYELDIKVATPSEVATTINQLYQALSDIDTYVQRFEASTGARTSLRTNVETMSDDAPVVQIVNLLINQAQRDRVSDVHIEPQGDDVRVRFRVDGALHDAQILPGSLGPALVSRIKVMAGMNIVERRRPQDGQFAIEVDGHALDVRVATTATVWGEKAVLRLLDKSRPLYRLDELGMPKATHEAFSKMTRSPFGMVICAGPTGAGKTTTLYGTLNEINDPERNIMTIEDPVEYIFPSINQIQMNEQAGLSFADGLKSMLRQDPDVILVGEVRDVETARIAVQSALTGHFVLSSLHATDSAAALHRLLDMGVESFLIASSVLGVVAQRLVRRICESCKEVYKPSSEELDFYNEAGGRPKRKFYEGVGCNLCAGTGYKDRVGVYELLRVTPELKRLVVGWATQDEIRRMAMTQGMRTLRQEGIALVSQDITTVSEVVRNVYAI